MVQNFFYEKLTELEGSRNKKKCTCTCFCNPVYKEFHKFHNGEGRYNVSEI